MEYLVLISFVISKESPGKIPPLLATIRQHLCQYKCIVKHYSPIQCHAILFPSATQTSQWNIQL
jgi:hypothetical protein